MDTAAVENYVKDEFGQWAIDEVTGEQGNIDDQRSCFWTWDNEYIWQKEKEKAKVDSKEKEEHSLVENKHRTLNGGQKKIVLGGTKEHEARRACQKAMMAFRKVVVVHINQKITGSDFNAHKGRGKTLKGKGKEGAYPQSGFSASEAPGEERYSQSLELDDWYSSLPDDSCSTLPTAGNTAWIASVALNLAHGRLDRERQSKGSRNTRGIMTLRKNFAPAISPLCLPTLRQRLVWKAQLFIFRQHLHVLPELMCGQRAYLILSSSDEEFLYDC